MTQEKGDQHRVLRLGVVGVGGMGYQHCRNIVRDVREARLACVCDADLPTARKAGAEFGVPAFGSYPELFGSGLCDAVLIATPHPLHPTIALEAFGAGLHVLSEKPLSERISTADAMVRAARRRRLVLGVMFQLRFHPACRKALELARSGALGRIYRATLIAPDYRSQAYYDAGRWRATWVGEGGGVLLNQSPHIVDFFVNLVGLPREVRGTVGARLHDIEVEDCAEAVLKLRGGGSGYLHVSTTEPGPAQMVEVYGDKGKLIYRDGVLKYYRFDPPVREFTRRNKDMWARPKCAEVPLELPAETSGHTEVVRNFARHILFGEELLCDGQRALGQLELANAIILSGHTGKAVRLPLNRKAYDALLKKLCRASRYSAKKAANQRITDPRFVK